MTDVAASSLKVQIEGIQFNQPASEATQSAVGGLANYLREIILPVGSVLASMLDEATFQSQTTSPTPERWILADGRSVVGSAYQSLTGNANIPDLRGISLRSKNNGRVDGNQNPDGDLALGTFTTNRFGSHNHGFSDPGHTHRIRSSVSNSNMYLNSNAYPTGSNKSAVDAATTAEQITNTTDGTGITFTAQGGNDTAPSNVTINYFIRIN